MYRIITGLRQWLQEFNTIARIRTRNFAPSRIFQNAPSDIIYFQKTFNQMFDLNDRLNHIYRFSNMPNRRKFKRSRFF